MTKDEEDDDFGKAPPQLLVIMPPMLLAELAKTWVILPVSIATRIIAMRQSVLSQRKTETPQKTSDSLGNLRIEETNVDGAPEATLEQVPCIRPWNTFSMSEHRRSYYAIYLWTGNHSSHSEKQGKSIFGIAFLTWVV